MKKLFNSAVFTCIMMHADAQLVFGVHAGINYADVKTGYKEYQYSKTSTKKKPGIVIGLLAELPVSKKVIFRPEINFIQKGVKMTFMNAEFGPVEIKSREHTLSFIEMPLSFMYRLLWSKGTFYIGGGPSVAFGLGGQNKYVHEQPALSGTGHIKFDGRKQEANESNVHLKPLDIGLNLNMMMELSKGFFVNLGYTAGINSLDIDDQWNSYKTNGISLKLGYMFGSRRKLGKYVSEDSTR